jgi:hypothetical protein
VAGDDIRWLTYREMKEALRLPSEKAALSRSRRENWPRQLNNERGLALVGVPLSAIETAANRSPPEKAPDSPPGNPPETDREPSAGALPDGLEAELRRRAETAEARIVELVAELDRAEDERDRLAAEIIQERERRIRAEGEAALARTEATGHRVAFEQAQGRAERAEAGETAARDVAAQERAQATEARAARAAAERERDAARGELAELTTGGPLRRALRAFVFRRGRP